MKKIKKLIVDAWWEDRFSFILLSIFVVFGSILLLDLFIITDKERIYAEAKAEEKAVRNAEQQALAEMQGLNGIRYIKDTRTGNCFALIDYYRQMGLATVDCDTLQNVDVIEN